MKVFVDTNVLVDFVCRRAPFADAAKLLFAHGFLGEYALKVSALSFVNSIYISKKYKVDVKPYLRRISTFVEVVDLSGDVVVEMLSSEWKDYEDACQNEAAVLSCCDCIVTRNKKDFLESLVPVYTVEEFFAVFDEQRKGN